MGRPPEAERKRDSGAAERERRRHLTRAYQGALEAVLAVVVAGLAGAWADSRFGTSPALLLVGIVLGFGTFVMRLVRLGREMHPPGGGAGGSDGSSPSDGSGTRS